MDFNKTKHWENIYQTKSLNEVSWYQANPQTSLKLIEQCDLLKDAAIIDVGGGDSFLVDNLLELKYTNVSVLDISQTAINRAKKRLGKLSKKVKWIVEDITTFTPFEKYDFWHDRAAFHFLTQPQNIEKYKTLVKNNVQAGGVLAIGTFSEIGPKKCSGIEIKQYSENSLTQLFEFDFTLKNSFTINHKTPFDTEQNFVFCTFTKS